MAAISNDVAIRSSCAAAASVSVVVLGRSRRHLSTPAASAVIRKARGVRRHYLSASPIRAVPVDDFGIKYNQAAAGPPMRPSPTQCSSAQEIERYHLVGPPDVDLARLGETRIGDMVVEIIDPVADYAELLESLFDFRRSICWRVKFRMRFDTRCAVTGPYAKIWKNDSGAGPDRGQWYAATRLRRQASIPNPVYAADLVTAMADRNSPHCPFGAASDGDGDRNMIIGRNFIVSPNDNLARHY